MTDLHDLHIWAMSTTDTALTAHLVMPDGVPSDAFLHDLAATLKERYFVDHATFQVERGGDEATCHQSLHCAD